MSYDEAGKTFKYKIKPVDVKVLPVTTHPSFMTVKAVKRRFAGDLERGFLSRLVIHTTGGFKS
jgi:hypothetical protein